MLMNKVINSSRVTVDYTGVNIRPIQDTLLCKAVSHIFNPVLSEDIPKENNVEEVTAALESEFHAEIAQDMSGWKDVMEVMSQHLGDNFHKRLNFLKEVVAPRTGMYSSMVRSKTEQIFSRVNNFHYELETYDVPEFINNPDFTELLSELQTDDKNYCVYLNKFFPEYSNSELESVLNTGIEYWDKQLANLAVKGGEEYLAMIFNKHLRSTDNYFEDKGSERTIFQPGSEYINEYVLLLFILLRLSEDSLGKDEQYIHSTKLKSSLLNDAISALSNAIVKSIALYENKINDTILFKSIDHDSATAEIYNESYIDFLNNGGTADLISIACSIVSRSPSRLKEFTATYLLKNKEILDELFKKEFNEHSYTMIQKNIAAIKKYAYALFVEQLENISELELQVSTEGKESSKNRFYDFINKELTDEEIENDIETAMMKGWCKAVWPKSTFIDFITTMNLCSRANSELSERQAAYKAALKELVNYFIVQTEIVPHAE